MPPFILEQQPTIEGIKAGSPRDLRNLKAFLWLKIHRFLRNTTSDPVEINDALAEVFGHIWRNRDGFRDMGSLNEFAIFHIKIMFYKIKNKIAASKRLHQNFDQLVYPFEGSDDEEEMITMEMIQQMHTYIETLDQADLDLVRLMLDDDNTSRCARKLNLHPTSVINHWRRIVLTLREKWQQEPMGSVKPRSWRERYEWLQRLPKPMPVAEEPTYRRR